MPHRLNIQPGSAYTASRGFTLVELLVVIAIISILMGVMVNSLAQARDSARAVMCQSNLKQMQVGWQMFIQQGDGKISDIRYNATGVNWRDAMNVVYQDAPSIFKNGGNSFGACPGLQAKYKDISYPGGIWGYAINSWWDSTLPSPDCYSDQKSWSAIVRPSDYPWFLDPQVYDITGGIHSVPQRVPYNPVGSPDWGIGANHARDTVTNASFADGSSRAVPITEIRSRLQSPDYAWLENR